MLLVNHFATVELFAIYFISQPPENPPLSVESEIFVVPLKGYTQSCQCQAYNYLLIFYLTITTLAVQLNCVYRRISRHLYYLGYYVTCYSK